MLTRSHQHQVNVETDKQGSGGRGGGNVRMSCQASQESKHTGVHLEKRETLGVGEVKDVPSDDECDPAVECFSVVYR